MNKLKLFTENMLVYGLGGIISKAIPLIMVPIVTLIMPSTDYFGISDLSNTLVQFASAIAIMGMYDAMYRMFFERDEEDYKVGICSTALIFTIFTSIIVFIIMLIFRDVIASFFFSNKEYAYVVYLSAIATLVGSTNSIVSAPTRMQNKRKVYLVTNTISPLLSYGISIPLLLSGYYVIALPLAAVISGITMEISFGVLNHKWFSFRRFDTKMLKQLLVLAIPLLPNFLVYWIFNSCDKVMITNMLGIGAAGIYSVGSKLGHASQLIYTAFAGGWQYFAFSTMKEENQVKNNSLIFEYLGIISFVATAFICVLSYWIFKLLFKVDYLEGYIVAPYLFLAPLLQMLFQVIGNQFLVVKKTWPITLILLSGTVINVVTNYFFIPLLGIEGASIATLVGYVVSDIICVIVLCKMDLMKLSSRFVIATIIMGIFMVLWRLFFSEKIVTGIVSALILVIAMIVLYKSDLQRLYKLVKSRKNKDERKDE
ncbi:MAG: polysaccharide biosynthesis protein [Lachnospiraceae bacterium]|nr:polysaccharide biosynthesis protein [Lachnospiraceae bacterium]